MSSKKPVIVFRADGSSEIGLGHLIRSSALAETLKEEFTCILATRCKIDPLLQILKSSFGDIISLPDIAYYTEAKDLSNILSSQNLVVLDGYNFDSEYQKVLVDQGFDLFSIDDIHAFPFHSRVIINHAGGISPLEYRALPYTQFYLGPRYSLLRHAFLQAARQRRNAITDKNCFICFGGADPDNRTLEVLKSGKVRNFSEFEHFHVVVGSAYQYKSELEAFVRDQNITLYYALSPEEMAALMQRCSFAICSPSSVVYEYMSVGGVVFLEQIADNQKDVIRFFTEQGLAFTLDDLGSLDNGQIVKAFEKQAWYFDGRSGERFRKLFRQYFTSKSLSIRRARLEDLETCFHWANDPEVRAQSYNQSSIDFSEHVSWFKQKLSDPNNFFYILEMDNKPVGQVRFQLSNEEAVIGYLADKKIRSMGLGTSILCKGIESFLQTNQKKITIKGFVKKSNVPSQRSFERLAFVRTESMTYPDSFEYSMFYGNYNSK